MVALCCLSALKSLIHTYLGIGWEGAGRCFAFVAQGRGPCAGGPLDVLNRRPPERLLVVCVRRIRLGIGAACLQASRSNIIHPTGHCREKGTRRALLNLAHAWLPDVWHADTARRAKMYDSRLQPVEMP